MSAGFLSQIFRSSSVSSAAALRAFMSAAEAGLGESVTASAARSYTIGAALRPRE